MELFDQPIEHGQENNRESEEHYTANVERFSAQCVKVLTLLQSGVKLTSMEAMMHGIGHLPRRILDLKEKGVKIDDEFVTTLDGKTTRFKRYFIK